MKKKKGFNRILSLVLTITMIFSTLLSTGVIVHASILPLEEETVYLILNKETEDQLKQMKISTILNKLQDSDGNSISIDGNATTVWHYSKDADSGLETYEAYLIDGSDSKRIDLSQPAGVSMQTIELIVGKDGQLNEENVRYIVKVYYTGYNNNISYELYSQSADGTKRTKIEPLKKTYANGTYDKIIDVNGNPIPLVNAMYSFPEGDILNPYLCIKCSIDERPDVRVEFYELTDKYLTNPITDKILCKDMTKLNSGYKMSGEGAAFIARYYIDGMDAGVQVYFFMISGSFPHVTPNLFEISSGIKNSVVANSNEDIDINNDIYTFQLELNDEKNGNDNYYLNFDAKNGDVDLSNSVIKAVVGHYDSISEAAGAPDIKSELFSKTTGYKANFSGNGVDFTLFFEDDVIFDNIPYKLTIKAAEYGSSMREYTDKPIIGEADPWMRITGATNSSGAKYDTYVIENGKNINMDTYYGYGYQTIFIKDANADLSTLKPEFWYANTKRVYAVSKDTGNKVEEGHTRNFTKENQQYTGVIIDKKGNENERNYWITFKKLNNSGSELFVYGPREREVILDEYFEFKHDILIANIGNKPLEDISVELLDAENVKLDPYWTVGGSGNNTLAPFTTTIKSTQYGELANLAKIRLLPDGDGKVKGTLVIKAKNQEPVMISLNGTAKNPEIITEKLDEAVKYVPYQHIIATNNMHDWIETKFTLSEGKLPDGITLNEETGEIYGVPTVPESIDSEPETYTFTVKAQYLVDGQDGYFEPSYKEFSIVVNPNTDKNVYEASDENASSTDLNDGYTIKQYIGTKTGEYTFELENIEDTEFTSYGHFDEFVALWLNGELLEPGVDYVAESGSTKITIKSQTFENKTNPNGTNTIAMEFRKDNNGDGKGDKGAEMHRTAQNFVTKVVTSVQKVIEKIEAIPAVVTLAAKGIVQTARNAYNALTSTEKPQVTNYGKLTSAEDTITKLEKEATDKTAADKVIAKINAIPSLINSDAKDEIQDARAAYNSLSTTQKNLVTNYDRLTKAESALATYEAQQAQIAADKAAANKVVNLISAIPSSVSLSDKNTVNTARTAYNMLSAAQKGYVSNYSKLTDAESRILELEAEAQEQAVINNVITKINDIPNDLTLNDKSKVEAARKAYDALTSAQKSKVVNYDDLTAAEKAIEALEAQEKANKADLEAAQSVIDLIDAIPEKVSLNNKSQIVSVRDKYDDLSNKQKKLVTNYSKLTDAEATIKSLEDYEEANKKDKEAADKVINLINNLPTNVSLNDKDKIEAARKAYDALTDKQKAIVTNIDTLKNAEIKLAEIESDAQEQAKSNAVIAKINDIPDDLTLNDKPIVEAARKAYDALTPAQKSKVVNYNDLTAAEKTIEALEAQEKASETDKAAAQTVIDLINTIPDNVTLNEKSLVESIRSAYNSLSNKQKQLVSNYSKLTDAEATIKALEDYENAAEADREAADKVMDLINNLPDNIDTSNKSQIEEARNAYDALTDNQKKIVSNLEKLTDAEVKLAESENKEFPDDETMSVTFIGILVDKNGNALPNMIVEIHSAIQTCRTDENGSFQFNNVEFGNHTILVKDNNGKVIAEKDFEIICGSPFSLKKNKITTENSSEFTITVELDDDELKFLNADSGNKAPEVEQKNDNENKGIDIGEGSNGNNNTNKSSQLPDNYVSPQTGDETNLVFWYVLLIMSIIGLATTTYLGKKNKKFSSQDA